MKEIIKFGDIDVGALKQAENCLVDAEKFCLMADNHKGYGMPVGGVAAYKNKICPAGVGFDIACGNKAVRTNLRITDVRNKLDELGQQIANTISFGVGRKNKEQIWAEDLFNSERWDTVELYRENPGIKQIAQEQLGTIGSGNHYVDVFVDEDGCIWVGVHFGSRGLGHKTASHFMKLAGDNPNIMDETPHLLDVESYDGQQYIEAMKLCGDYAYAGRDWVCNKVVDILGGTIDTEVHNHHNFAWLENHGGEDYWVVRKGATPAFPGQYGFVGSSMGEDSVIIRGVNSELSQKALYSTIHGAGRVMSRTEAAGKAKWVNGKKQHDNSGKVHWENAKRSVENYGVYLFGGGADEAPEVYKRLPDVLEYHKGTIEVVNILKPLIVVMAGADEFDPYKD